MNDSGIWVNKKGVKKAPENLVLSEFNDLQNSLETQKVKEFNNFVQNSWTCL